MSKKKTDCYIENKCRWLLLWRDSRGVGKWECQNKECKMIEYGQNEPGDYDESDQLDN